MTREARVTRFLHLSAPARGLRRLSVALVLTVGATLTNARCVAAQEVDQHQRWASATWVDDANFLATNALLGGVTAGVSRLLHHGSFAEGFARGALGGGVAYLGKRTAAARFSGAGFLGREVGALGASVTRNAGMGVGLLDTLILPVGPLRAFVTPHALGASRIRVDLSEATWLVAALRERRLKLDWSRTFSAGAPVFMASLGLADNKELIDGRMVGGLVLLSPSSGHRVEDTFAHERVHVLQRDFVETTTGLPLERWLGAKLHLDRVPLVSNLVPGIGYWPEWYLLTGSWRTSRRFVEVEAYFLESR